ncbi:MAG TPA: aminoacyl-histidine dipeptidase [Candidatus Aminicenantes bacterium]|nr:aminoacyl-histidine dipeptidase [Candidatus Aminicenantes bacterium]HRY65222.1 aminoacyl-histidine dipeptidase [Candidatus Aminicenantes bacterium]HRZ72310.1 aminoacyl-histidine dipeptidase [Candidatus Aminicenantes bacterium]
MAPSLEELDPRLLWKHFAKILTIPHCSGHEKPLGDYVLSVAASLGLPAKRDKVGNVLVSKPATPGREGAVGVVLQGHLDMVCEKNSGTAHDFGKDPIVPEIKGEWVYARGTTLGADNGIGLAAALAVLEDKALVHGPLEALFTVDEETGLTGANKIQKGFIAGRMLLNLDSEDEGTFTIGCAGGADSTLVLPLARKKTASKNLYTLHVHGFRGGHSGLDINQGRGNAVKLLARLLAQGQAAAKFELVSLAGGSKHNAIPREAVAVLACPPVQVRTMTAAFKKAFDKIKTEYKAVEPGAAYTLTETAGKDFALTQDCQRILIDFLLALPHGVIAMHPEIPGLTETSTNLAIVKTGKAAFEVLCSTRSSVASALEATRGVIQSVCALAGAKADFHGGYPGWMPNLDSELLKKLKELYARTFGKEAEVVAVHAGLECGIIGEKFPGMDMISFGPTLKNPHSPEEHVHIGSVEKFYKFLTAAVDGLSS